jgi:hypothetical protein
VKRTCVLALLVALGCQRPGGVPVPDVDTARSTNGEVAFVRPTPQHIISTSLGQEQATELWIASSDGSNARRLVTGARSDSVPLILADLSSPSFSPDGKRVYFLSSAWVTSKAVHAVDVASGREWYIAPGNTLEVIPRGEFAGCLLVAQHRYSAESGGSYDWVWVLTPNGRQLMKASDDSEDAERQLAEWKRVNVPSDAKTGGARPKSRADCLAN